jgi:hypothetical protein
MNNSNNISLSYQEQLLQDRFALKLTAKLSDAADALPHDINERLRAARVRALGARKIMVAQTVPRLSHAGAGTHFNAGDEDLSWWNRIAAALPLIALVAGFVAIQVVQNDNRTRELAEVDAALLTDDLPPAAFTDPGFAQFLKASRGQTE